ncbi:alpha/beta fold hydrolase [Herbiconiux sp. YIM B11900]|uniref:alpha/beta fold hydrolase n=1 Tax=Herbiconiux sp. YIM B11900 TaxID=3404131 RepID=UPI003F87DB70
MTDSWARQRSAYSPFPLDGSPERFGLVARTLATALGEVTVYTEQRTMGGRTAVVLLHGAAGSWTTWTPLLRAAADSAGGALRDPVLIDLPGWGASPLPDDRSLRTVDGYARMIAAVLRELGYHEWIVLGHSLGGFIGLHLAAVETEATKAVALVSPTTFAVAEASRDPELGRRTVPSFVGLLTVMRAFAPLGRTASALLRAAGTLGLLRRIVSPLFAEPSRIDASVVQALAREVRPKAFLLAAREAARYDAVRWRRIRVPVRVVHGMRDAFVTASDDHGLSNTVHDLRVTVLPEAGHFGHVESPFAVLDAVGEVLPRQRGASRY